MRVSLVTCVWQRRELTRAFWIWVTWLRRRWHTTHRIALDVVAAASTEQERAVAQSFGFHCILHDNAPLGAKFNAALHCAKATDPAMVLIMGSDDFFCAAVADALGDSALAGRSVGFRDLYYLDLPTMRVRYLPGYRAKSRWTEPVGCGTLHRRDTLEFLNWRLWDGSQHAGMDNSRFATLKAHRAMPELLHLKSLDGVMVDVKSGVNIWPFDRTQKQPVLSEQEGRAVLARLPDEVIDAMPWPVAAAA